jgi:hypothetical protein
MEQEKSKKQPSKSKEPEHNPYLGDLAPAYIEWYGNNHSIDEFYIKYVKRQNRVPMDLRHFFNKHKSNQA